MFLLLAITYTLLGISLLCAFYFFKPVLETSDKIAIIVPPAIAAIYAHFQYLYYRNEERRHKKEEALDGFEKRFRDLIEFKNSVGFEQKTDNLSWFRIPSINIGEFRTNPFSVLRNNVPETKSGVIAFQDNAVSISHKTLNIESKGSFPPEVRYDWIDAQGNRNLEESYKSRFKMLDDHFGHYFSSLCALIRSVEKEKEFNKDDKEFCITRIRHSLSGGETFCLFYYCMNTNLLCKKLKDYVEKYGLFENLTFICLEDAKMHEGKFYNPSAFGDRETIIRGHYST